MKSDNLHKPQNWIKEKLFLNPVLWHPSDSAALHLYLPRRVYVCEVTETQPKNTLFYLGNELKTPCSAVCACADYMRHSHAHINIRDAHHNFHLR